MPRAEPSDGSAMVTSWPSQTIEPLSIGLMPAMHLIRVDLPAPLSPTSAVTSPARTVKSTPLSASTAPKCLRTPCSWSSGTSWFTSAHLLLPASCEPVLLAQRDEPARADLLYGTEPRADHGLLHICPGHRDRREQHRRYVVITGPDRRRLLLRLAAL